MVLRPSFYRHLCLITELMSLDANKRQTSVVARVPLLSHMSEATLYRSSQRVIRQARQSVVMRKRS